MSSPDSTIAAGMPHVHVWRFVWNAPHWPWACICGARRHNDGRVWMAAATRERQR